MYPIEFQITRQELGHKRMHHSRDVGRTKRSNPCSLGKELLEDAGKQYGVRLQDFLPRHANNKSQQRQQKQTKRRMQSSQT